MKTLYLIRHAKSSWDNLQLKDFDRPLNKRGQRDAPFMGNILHKKNVQADLLLSSPANRAISTARIIAHALHYSLENIVTNQGLYHASAYDILTIIRAVSNQHNNLLVFGHNPGFTYLSNALANCQIANVPTTGIVCIQFEVNNWTEVDSGKGKLVFFDYPKLYK